jgi:glycosyltransferase involved in cell wall biosynthesis
MKIIVLTAGTGSFHCGTCIRDNALVRELRRQGHDAMLVPMYLAPTLDEESTVDGSPLFFGGINVYLQQKLAFFRKSPRWLDNLFDSPALLRIAGKKAGMTSARELGEMTLSMLKGEEGNQIKEVERLATWLESERPDIVALSHALLLGVARCIRRRTGAKMVCFLNGEDGFMDGLPAPYSLQAWEELDRRARDIDAFIAVSRYYGNLMASRSPEIGRRLRVIYPGINLEGYSPAVSRPDPPILGYLARLNAIKGLGTLVDAYLILRKRNRVPGLRLRAAGTATAADESYIAEQRRRLDAAGYGEDVQFLPNLDRDEKVDFLRSLSLLSVPATYGESFGLFVIEALAAGTPVVEPRHAAFPELIDATRGGLLYEPDDPEALAETVERLLLNRDQAALLAEQGRQAVLERFSIERSAAETAALFKDLCGVVTVKERELVHAG